MIKSVKLSLVGGLLRVAGILLDSLERPHADEPITDGDPAGLYEFPPLPPLTLRVIRGGNTDSVSYPLASTESNEQ
jgi:hypothetical protein